MTQKENDIEMLRNKIELLRESNNERKAKAQMQKGKNDLRD